MFCTSSVCCLQSEWSEAPWTHFGRWYYLRKGVAGFFLAKYLAANFHCDCVVLIITMEVKSTTEFSIIQRMLIFWSSRDRRLIFTVSQRTETLHKCRYCLRNSTNSKAVLKLYWCINPWEKLIIMLPHSHVSHCLFVYAFAASVITKTLSGSTARQQTEHDTNRLPAILSHLQE